MRILCFMHSLLCLLVASVSVLDTWAVHLCAGCFNGSGGCVYVVSALRLFLRFMILACQVPLRSLTHTLSHSFTHTLTLTSQFAQPNKWTWDLAFSRGSTAFGSLNVFFMDLTSRSQIFSLCLTPLCFIKRSCIGDHEECAGALLE